MHPSLFCVLIFKLETFLTSFTNINYSPQTMPLHIIYYAKKIYFVYR